MNGKLVLVSYIIVVLSAGLVLGQSGRHRDDQPSPSIDQSSQEESGAITLGTTEVVVPVTVRNRYGFPIAGLSKSDFTLYEDGRRQTISGFETESVGANIAMLIDVSGSVQTEIDNIRLAALAVINELRDNDRVCIYQFNDFVRLVQDWTSDKLQLERTLMQLPATGATAFYNALYDSAQKLSQVEGRRTILILTDGVDTYTGQAPQSRGRTIKLPPPKTPEEAFEAVRRAEAGVYVISKTRALHEFLTRQKWPSVFRPLYPQAQGIEFYLQLLEQAEQWLTMLAERTGGKIYFPLSQTELRTVYADIAKELNSQYVLRYTPDDLNLDGRFRRIRVQTGNPAYVAYAREGYYAVRK